MQKSRIKIVSNKLKSNQKKHEKWKWNLWEEKVELRLYQIL